MKNRWSSLGVFLLLGLCLSTLFSEGFPFQNPEKPIDARIDDLIRRLSLEEKAALMLYNSPAIDRLGIPAYNWWNESLHGLARAGRATVFPQAIGLAASFDENLMLRVATAISDEARAKHNAALAKGSRQQYTGLSFWSPNVNIYRDPRWGRGQETYGEDPFLTAKLGVAYVRGMQGDDPHWLKTAACAKHFVVHSGPEALRHSFNAQADEVDFHETYTPAFKALVEAGVESVMCAYNQVNGEPCCGSLSLLTGLLRRTWHFQGHIVSDCWALEDFIGFQKIVDNGVDAAVLALKAGVNLNCGVNYKFIPQAVRQGKMTEKSLDDRLRPLLRTRFRLGLFDEPDPTPYQNLCPDLVNGPEHRRLALEAARRSIVLLQNRGGVLPLRPAKLQKLNLTGPTMADTHALLGNYNGLSGDLVTFMEGIVHRLDIGTVVDYAPGTLLTGKGIFGGFFQAEEADAIIAAIGNTSLLEGENGDALLSDFGGDRRGIALPGNQVELIRRLREKIPGKPLIVVVTGGGAVDLREVCTLADAVLFAWYPGEQGGNALADILFGQTSPSGRLPVTFYAQTDDLPAFEDYSMDNRSYRFFRGRPLFPFGHGLSYASFSYDDLTVRQENEKAGRELRIEVTVKNSGAMAGEEVVQLYVVKPARHRRNPIRSLCGFQRVFLEPGEHKRVVMRVALQGLTAWDAEKKDFALTKGDYRFDVGPNSADVNVSATLELK